MTKFSLNEIKEKVDELALEINTPADLLPTYGYSRDFAHPNIEIDNAGLLHYVIIERGQELERKTTNNLDDLLYWIFASVTFSMACEFELKNRIVGKDCRRIMFKKQEELLGILSDTWQQKKNEENKIILKNNPFDDSGWLRAIWQNTVGN